MHLKRQKAPKNWPIARKGNTFVVRPNSHLGSGLPILVILRDVLKIAQNRKEVKRALNFGNIQLNKKPVIDEKTSATLFDVITIVPEKKSYRLEFSEGGKFSLAEVKESESGRKVSKIVDKKVLKGKKTQLNLNDGKNFVSDIKCNVNDSIVIDFKSKKAEKCLPLKENARVFVFEGKHAGKRGTVKGIDEKHKMAEVDFGENSSNVLIKQLIVTE